MSSRQSTGLPFQTHKLASVQPQASSLGILSLPLTPTGQVCPVTSGLEPSLDRLAGKSLPRVLRRILRLRHYLLQQKLLISRLLVLDLKMLSKASSLKIFLLEPLGGSVG